MYFIEDLKKMRNQFQQERLSKEEAQGEVRDLRQTLKRVDEEALACNYELQALKHHKQIDMASQEHHSKDIMVKSQIIQIKELEIAEIRDSLTREAEQHRMQSNQYEEELKLVKRLLAEEEVKGYKTREEL